MSATDEDRLARLVLSAIGEPGDPRLADLVAAQGASAVRARLLADHDVEDLQTDPEARRSAVDPERTLADAERRGIRFVVPGDSEWPAGLDDLAAAPPLQRRGGVPLGLWVRGPTRLDDLAGSVAVVGSRSATTYGADIASRPPSPGPAGSWCPGRRSGSTRPGTVARSPPVARRSPS